MHVKRHEQAYQARRLMDRAYNSPITIQQLSREVAMSPYHLIRVFRRVYKLTPHQYLMQQRIAKAKELLAHTDLSITDICVQVGFESLGSFSALFRKAAGISPKDYRARRSTTAKTGYIPLCACILHGLEHEAENNAISEKQS